MIDVFLASLGLALVSEIADKTQLVILGLALSYKSPTKVFLGALSAHAVMDTVAILLGSFIGASLPQVTVKLLVALVFIAVGLRILMKLYLFKPKKKEWKKIENRNAFIVSFLTVALSEFGDKTQIAGAAFAAQYLQPLPIIAGFVVGIALAIGFNVFLGSKIAEKLPRKLIKTVTAILFIGFGIASLLL